MVFPLYDESVRQRVSQPYVTWTLVAINVVVFVGMCLTPDVTQVGVVQKFGFTPAVLFGDLPNPGPLPALLTPLTDMFIHISWDHLFFNMLFLMIFGDNVEDALGHVRFVFFYVACSFGSDLAYALPNIHATEPVVGASGAISGVVAAYLMIRPCANIKVLFFWVPVSVAAYWVVGFFVASQVWSVLRHTQDGVAYWAHIGGLLAGAALFPFLRHPDVVLFECMSDSTDGAFF